MNHNFLKCGLIGCAMEIICSSLDSFFQNGDLRLTGHTSLHMFPIYGMGALFAPIGRLLKGLNFFLRGVIYTCLIFSAEYLTGRFLKERHMCPWDYSRARYNVDGLIRLDYAPAWFCLGLLFERCTLPKPAKKNS